MKTDSEKNIVTYRTEDATTPAQRLELWRSMLDTIKNVENWEVDLGSETDTICWISEVGNSDTALILNFNQHTGIVDIERNFRQDSLIPKSLTGIKHPFIRWSACYVSFMFNMEFTKKQHAADLIRWLHVYFGE